jgi:nucleoside-diphosphate-sugar epimerase
MVDEGNAGSVIVEDLEEAGFDVVGVNFTTHKANMVRLLANDLERAKAFVLDTHHRVRELRDEHVTPAGRITVQRP